MTKPTKMNSLELIFDENSADWINIHTGEVLQDSEVQEFLEVHGKLHTESSIIEPRLAPISEIIERIGSDFDDLVFNLARGSSLRPLGLNPDLEVGETDTTPHSGGAGTVNKIHPIFTTKEGYPSDQDKQILSELAYALQELLKQELGWMENGDKIPCHEEFISIIRAFSNELFESFQAGAAIKAQKALEETKENFTRRFHELGNWMNVLEEDLELARISAKKRISRCLDLENQLQQQKAKNKALRARMFRVRKS